MMTTTKAQLLEALQYGDSPADLVCFYQPADSVGYPGWDIDGCGEPVRCAFYELPEREYDEGHGGPMGEPCIAFSERYVYIKVQYDGSEWFTAIPRHPDVVSKPLPWPGG